MRVEGVKTSGQYYQYVCLRMHFKNSERALPTRLYSLRGASVNTLGALYTDFS